MRRALASIGAAVVVIVLAAGAVRWWVDGRGSELEQATQLVPAGSQRLTWTDWRAIRGELGADVDADSSADEVLAFLDEGFERDLTSTSALLGSAEVLQERYGFSPASIDTELLAQSDEGAVLVLDVSESVDLADVAGRLADLGYTEDGDLWRGGVDVLAGIEGTPTPELAFLSLDEEGGRILASDTGGYLEQVLDVAAGDADGFELSDVVGATGDPLSASIYTGDYVCGQLSMNLADEDDQAQAAELIEQAGEVNPMTGFSLSTQPDGTLRVVMSFESDDQARTNADTRSVLARGPAPGQGGDFADRFAVDEVTADGMLVTMALDPVEGEYVQSDLSSGPVLFATC